jgi:hypothetical protein
MEGRWYVHENPDDTMECRIREELGGVEYEKKKKRCGWEEKKKGE